MKTAKVDDPVTFGLLRTIPGIGPILGLVLLYEIDTIDRFPEVGQLPVVLRGWCAAATRVPAR